MSKRATILGLVLLLAGAGSLGWVVTEQRKEEKLQQQRREQIRTNLNKLDEIMEDPYDLDPRKFDGIVYEETSRADPQQYARREEMRATALTIGGVLALSGGTLLGWAFALGGARLVVGCSRSVARLSRGVSQKPEKTDSDKEPEQEAPAEQPDQDENEERPEEPRKPYFGAWRDSQRQQQQTSKETKSRDLTGKPAVQHPARQPSRPLQTSKDLKNKDHDVKPTAQQADKQPQQSKQPENKDEAAKPAVQHAAQETAKQEQATLCETDQAQAKKGQPTSKKATARKAGNKKEEPMAKHTDKDAETTEAQTNQAAAGPPGQAEPPEDKATAPETKRDSDDTDNNAARLEESFKSQTENLEKQMAEFKRMAETVRETAVTQSHPVEDSIKELAEQVSAIREYAAHQQERVKKLQDGYDWNIVRNFCLRIIRCIDNIESKMETLLQGGKDITSLEEFRDELAFALESTGVESFEPEIRSDYRGQEKNTEAIKDRETCDDPQLVGKVAKVIRRGYQYCIDDENVKVVRPAQVKLFGQNG